VGRHPTKESGVDYESPEIIGTYVEDELVAEAAVSTRYCVQVPD
jgi:hypothetical protein